MRFVSTAMMAVISQAVTTRENLHQMTSDLAQTAVDAEGCGETPRGSMVPYKGPQQYAPERT